MCFRHSGVQFFDRRTSKSAPNPTCFVHFHFPMCLFTTSAYNFSTSELQKVLRDRQFLSIFTSKCAFRHSGVQFFHIWTSKSAPSTVMFCKHFHFTNVLFATAACNFWCRLSAPTSAPAALTGLLFDWPDTRIIEKTHYFATSLTFGADVSSFFWLSRYCIFFLLTWLTVYICFSTVHIVGSLLFKLPSTT